MKLITRILINTAVSLAFIISAWMIVTYYITVSEVYEEVDEYLKKYAEGLIKRFDNGVSPDSNSANFWVNSTCFMERISESYGRNNPEWNYTDMEIYLDDIRKDQDVRALEFNYGFPDGRWYRVTVISPSFDKEDFSAILVNSSIILGGMLVLVTISIIAFIIYRRMRPMYKLLDWLRKHKVGEPADFTGDKKEITEIRLIREAVMDSVEKANEIYEQQKLFIGNASHEMQTPLAVCKNSVEMLAEDPDMTEKQLVHLERIDDRLSYMSKLNKTLLMLSKIDNGKFEDTEEVSLGKLADECSEDVSEIYSAKNISLEISGNSEIRTRIDPTLAGALVGNLIRNAFIHNKKGGHVHIIKKDRKLTVANTSPAGPLDVNEIYKRFYKGDSTSKSTGLGLSIVDAICKRYGFRITYSYKDGMHFFTIGI